MGVNHMKWPVIIKHDNDMELVYVNDQSEWNSDIDLHLHLYDESDYLIDVSGACFSLTRRINKSVTPEPNGNSRSLDEILGLVKGHAAQSGSCCVAKLYAPSIRDAFKIVKAINDDRV